MEPTSFSSVHEPAPAAPAPTPIPPRGGSYAVPAAIIIAGALIAGAVYLTSGRGATQQPIVNQPAATEIILNPVTDADHMLGSKNADMVFVEFSDLECPACRVFHPTMKQLMEKFGKDATMSWVYRHYPLLSIHPRAAKEAMGAECVASLGGEDAFWRYIHRLFEVTPANNGLPPEQIPVIAKEVSANETGFTAEKFASCLAADTFKEKIQGHITDGTNAKITGTPYTVILLKNPLNKSEQTKVYEALQAATQIVEPGALFPADLLTFNAAGDRIVLGAAFPYEIMEALVESATK